VKSIRLTDNADEIEGKIEGSLVVLESASLKMREGDGKIVLRALT